MEIKVIDPCGLPNRYCEGCGRDHGPLYICKRYSRKVRAQIREQRAEFDRKVSSPAFWQEFNAALGMTEEESAMAQALYGGPKAN